MILDNLFNFSVPQLLPGVWEKHLIVTNSLQLYEKKMN